MADEELPREEELEHQQGNLYPVGRALRRTFDAENHDSLGTDLTGLMLELARVDNERAPGRGAMPTTGALPPPAPPVPLQPDGTPPPTGLRSLIRRLLR